MRGLIQYVVDTDTPQQGLWASYQPWTKTLPWADTLTSGQTAEIYLVEYGNLDPTIDTDKSVSKSTALVTQTRFFSQEDGWRTSFNDIDEDRTTWNPYSVYNALNRAANEGTVLTWYPNIDDHPTEFYSVIVEDVRPPRREGPLLKWTFSFDFTILPDVQFPSTVPVFV